MSNLPSFDDKAVAEQDFFAFDMSNRLTTGEVINTVAFSLVVAPDSPAADATPSSMLSGSAAFSGAIVEQKLIDGVDGAIYVITAAVTTDKPRIIHAAARLRVLTDLV